MMLWSDTLKDIIQGVETMEIKTTYQWKCPNCDLLLERDQISSSYIHCPNCGSFDNNGNIQRIDTQWVRVDELIDKLLEIKTSPYGTEFKYLEFLINELSQSSDTQERG